jgi:MFS family permease
MLLRPRPAFAAVAFGFAAMMATSALPTPLYGLYQQRDGFSTLTVTLIFAAYAVGVALSLFLVGHVSDWRGRRAVLVPALLVGAASSAVFLVWRDLPGLLVARVINGLAVGAITATATAWLTELHPGRRAQLAAIAANLGGIGLGPLISGAIAQWIGAPLTLPYALSIVALLAAAALITRAPETRDAEPRSYRPQRISVPERARGAYFSAAVAGMVSFAAFGLFTSLAPSVLAGHLGDTSPALAGATAFVVFAAAIAAQMLSGRSGIVLELAGLAAVVAAVWIPSLALFLAGGIAAGAGSGLLFKAAVAAVAAISEPERRAEALAGLFLAGYIGLAVPVIGLGTLKQSLGDSTSLSIFAGALAVAGIAAAPGLRVRLSRPAS